MVDSRRLIVGFLLLVLNSAYLAARADASPIYFAKVVAHLALGLALVAAFIPWALRLRRELPPAVVAAALPLAVAAALGLVLMVTGATRPYRFFLHGHIAFAAAGSALLVAWLLRAAGRLALARERSAAQRAAVLAALAIVVTPALAVHARRQDGLRHRIANPASAPLSMEGEGAGPESPFFPSSAETNTGGLIPANFFLTSEACGRCHRDIYEQWNVSAHHFSSFNNQWCRKSVEYMEDVTGTSPPSCAPAATTTPSSASEAIRATRDDAPAAGVRGHDQAPGQPHQGGGP